MDYHICVRKNNGLSCLCKHNSIGRDIAYNMQELKFSPELSSPNNQIIPQLFQGCLILLFKESLS
jgi:hypothetical protein